MADPRFEFSVPIFKADGGEDAEWRFHGCASTVSIDRQGERMSESAIEGFKEQLFVPLCLGADHKSAMADVMSEIGVIDTVGGDSQTFEISGKIFKEHPYAEYVYSRLTNPEMSPDWKLSVGGLIPAGSKGMEWDSDEGMHVAVIKSFVLDHVFLCRGKAAVNQDTSIGAKAEDWADVVFKAAAEIDVEDENQTKQDSSSSQKAEDTNTEAVTMPEEVEVVPAADAGEEKLSPGTYERIFKAVMEMVGIGKADETPAVEEPEAAPVEQSYVTKDEFEEAMKAHTVELTDSMKAMLTELAEKLVPAPAPEDAVEKADPVVDEPAAEEPAAEETVVEETPVVDEPAADEEAGKSATDIDDLLLSIPVAGKSAQIPLVADAGKAAPAENDDDYPDILGAVVARASDPARAAESIVKTFCRK